MIRESPTKKKETPATEVWDQLPYKSMFGRETRYAHSPVQSSTVVHTLPNPPTGGARRTHITYTHNIMRLPTCIVRQIKSETWRGGARNHKQLSCAIVSRCSWGYVLACPSVARAGRVREGGREGEVGDPGRSCTFDREPTTMSSAAAAASLL